jgi:hypothetical protein
MMHTYRVSRLQSGPMKGLLLLSCEQNMSVEISPDILLKDKSKVYRPPSENGFEMLKYPPIWLWLTFLN